MVAVPTQAVQRIVKNRHWEDYQSLKKHWSHAGKFIREVLWDGYQITTAAAAELTGGTDATIALPAANMQAFVKSEADLAALDGDSIYIDYVSSTGVLHENVESKYDSLTNTSLEVAIGCKSGTYLDVIASIAGSALTMTNLDLSAVAANTLAGKYIVGSGAAPYGYNLYLTIASNTAANPTVITTVEVPNANWDDDSVCIVDELYNDVFRIRRAWTETESPTDNYQCVCDFNGGNIYAVVCDGNSHTSHSRYYSLGTDYRCFLGQIKASFPIQNEGEDTKEDGAAIQIVYTPKCETGQAECDVTITMDFAGEIDWQPCLEIEPCTDVYFKILKLTDINHVNMAIEYKILEARVTDE